ncbi:MAG: hypothetical protein E5W38_13325 [Mesorhizobium sp.]|uniref:hypothetical protein n=1 Tax=unclassified Mesorhizobium TaxID=325217 RepID=UPI000FCC4B56|nr:MULTISPECIES: hypothetical protein [unclassified Mesorhizobium]RUW76018.1 hypothetical protein EOA29_28345 [Mesorhizobium sp. M1E.F.Ca.ET.063.01.1.1]RWB57164.1 MAG: hypothetical protein EOQ47_11335 [Mesorhizobium sp.]TIU32248.1 MAG: hypothetical protein E5W38_13325 [Mesorhizobium sp.]TKB10608.1 MAG: hypothetical protein E5V75_28390 [Mesorhizobium sp.]
MIAGVHELASVGGWLMLMILSAVLLDNLEICCGYLDKAWIEARRKEIFRSHPSECTHECD